MATSGKHEVREPAPDWLDQWNFIKYAAMNLCDRPLVFYAETALPVAGDIALELLQFDWYSFVKRLIRPKQLRSGRHGRSGSRGGRRLPGIPEVSDIVAHHVDKTRKYRLPDTVGKTQFLFVIDDTIERANNLAFLIEESTKLPYRTLIGVIKADQSKCPDLGSLLRTGSSWGVTALEGPWNGFLMNKLEYARNINSGNNLFWGPSFGSWMVCLEVQCRAETPNASGFQIRIIDQAHGTVIAEVTGADPNEDDWMTLTISGTLPAGGVAAWQAGCTHSSIGMRLMKFFALRVG